MSDKVDNQNINSTLIYFTQSATKGVLAIWQLVKNEGCRYRS